MTSGHGGRAGGVEADESGEVGEEPAQLGRADRGVEEGLPASRDGRTASRRARDTPPPRTNRARPRAPSTSPRG